jgi:AcrR family transcriptional regulator
MQTDEQFTMKPRSYPSTSHPETPDATEKQLSKAIDHRPRVGAERRERMRLRLLRSALGLVAAKGHAATSVDDVIAAAQVSRGTFYKYFPSPDALVEALGIEIANELSRIVEPLAHYQDDPAEWVARGIRLVSRIAIHYPTVAGCLVRLGWPEDRGVSLLKFVCRDIEEGIRRKRFQRVPIALALTIVGGATLGATQRMLDSNCKQDFSRQAAAAALRALGMDTADADAISSKPLGLKAIRIDGWLGETLVDVDS